MKRLAVLTAAIILSLWMTSMASAQYPPPENVLIVSVSDPTPPTNSTVTITWSIPGTQTALPAGESTRRSLLVCSPAILSQPGTDASVKFLSESISASGVGLGSAELRTGSTPGRIVVRVACASGATADITVLVEGAAPQSPQSPAGQSGGGAATPRPPMTGSRGGGTGDFPSQAILVGVLGLVASSCVVVGGRLLTRKR